MICPPPVAPITRGARRVDRTLHARPPSVPASVKLDRRHNHLWRGAGIGGALMMADKLTRRLPASRSRTPCTQDADDSRLWDAGVAGDPSVSISIDDRARRARGHIGITIASFATARCPCSLKSIIAYRLGDETQRFHQLQRSLS